MIQKGNVTITHAVSEAFDVWGKKVTLKKPLRFAMLKVDGETVMSETPQEVGAMKKDSAGVRGRVLVAGLGLGVILQYLRPKCQVIDVVEPSQNVVAAYCEFRSGKPQYDNLWLKTIEEFLAEPPERKYDFVYLDTWYGLDSEYLPHINWMQEKARRLLGPGGRVSSWGYDWMVKQHVLDCMDIVKTKRKLLAKAPARNLEKMCVALPLIGAFSMWLKDNPKASLVECKAKALDIAMKREMCPVPLNVYKEWCLLRASQEDVKDFVKLASAIGPEGIVVGGQRWMKA